MRTLDSGDDVAYVWFTEHFHEPNSGSIYDCLMKFSSQFELFSTGIVSILTVVMMAIPSHATTAYSGKERNA
jgi:hypothetical protein